MTFFAAQTHLIVDHHLVLSMCSFLPSFCDLLDVSCGHLCAEFIAENKSSSDPYMTKALGCCPTPVVIIKFVYFCYNTKAQTLLSNKTAEIVGLSNRNTLGSQNCVSCIQVEEEVWNSMAQSCLLRGYLQCLATKDRPR